MTIECCNLNVYNTVFCVFSGRDPMTIERCNLNVYKIVFVILQGVTR